jgi:hypothetical protein
MNWFTLLSPNKEVEMENKESFLAWKELGRNKGGNLYIKLSTELGTHIVSANRVIVK